MYDLESIEVWELLAYIDQFYRCEVCTPNWAEWNSYCREPEVMWENVRVRAEDSEFCEPWTRSHRP